MRYVERLLKLPTSYDPIRDSAAQLLNGLLIVGIFASVFAFSLLIFFPESRAYNLLVVGTSGVITSLQLGLLRRGYLRLAGWSYVGLLWALATWNAAMFGGLHSSYPVFYVVTLLLASLLFGPRYALLMLVVNMATLSSLWAFGPTFEEMLRLINTENRAVISWVMHGVSLVFTTVIITYTGLNISHTLRTLRERNAALEIEIAERRRVEAQLTRSDARFRNMFDNAPFAIMMMNTDRSLREVNNRARSMFDISCYPGEKPVFLSHRLHPEDNIKHADLFQTLSSGDASSVQTESRLLADDGNDNNLTWIRVTLSRVDDTADDAPYVLAIIEDITETRLAAQRELDLQLERERLTFLRDFVDKMTHDLKTPLSVIKTSTYLLRRKHPELGIQVFTERIDEQVTQQMEMIENILTVARLDHMPQLALTSTNINTVLQNTIEEQRPEIMRQNHRLHLQLAPDLPPCMVDALQINRVLTNLVSNAVKYTPPGGTITIRTARTDDNRVFFTVADTGIGISPDDLPHIFDRFYRTDNTRQSHQGTGLGLAIVKEIVERHAGSIDVRSTLGIGTSFSVTLPAAS